MTVLGNGVKMLVNRYNWKDIQQNTVRADGVKKQLCFYIVVLVVFGYQFLLLLDNIALHCHAACSATGYVHLLTCCGWLG